MKPVGMKQIRSYLQSIAMVSSTAVSPIVSAIVHPRLTMPMGALRLRLNWQQTWHTCADYILADNEHIREQLEVDLTR
ncbi:hypothetical protein [Leptothermofonsia sp. ETS-13]|uniref:hypothetical protein n=1 Tax=Leptothermofonsia sp. ETS-13 TaxID=3035696 RepID=UPI003B9F63C5